MMKVLKATPAQYDSLNGFQSGANRLEFIEDGNGQWIVGPEVVNDPAFESIKSDLLLLEEIDYIPVQGDL
jgi:hypothetical protein